MPATTPTILVIDGEHHAQLYEMWVPDGYSVRTASTRQAALSAIDDTVGGVFLRHELQTDLKEQIESELDATSPAAQIAVTTTQRTDLLFPEVSCAEAVCQPITEAKIAATAETLVNRARYHEALRRYYRLTVRLTNREITDGDGHPDQYESLQRGRQRIASMLRSLRDRLDPDDRDAVVESLKTQLTLPKRSPDATGPTTKYRPDRCRDCGLPWSIDHGGDLGEGYRSLGAYAWKCRQCGTVQNIATPSNRGVARRRFSS